MNQPRHICISMLFLSVLWIHMKISSTTSFSNFNLDTNWDTYLCANENPIVDEKTIIITATGLTSETRPCLALRKNLKISGEYEISSQLIKISPRLQCGKSCSLAQRNVGLAFNVEDEKNYDFAYLR